MCFKPFVGILKTFYSFLEQGEGMELKERNSDVQEIYQNQVRVYMKILCMLLNAIKCVLDLLWVFKKLLFIYF